MKMNRYCPDCQTNSCKVEFSTLLTSLYCTKCLTRFEYSKSSIKFVRFVFSLAIFLSAMILFFTNSLILALGFLIVIMTPTLYMGIWHANLKVGGLKGVRRRIRDKRS